MIKKQPIDYEKSSGNVFQDLGLENPDDLAARVRVGFFVAETLKMKGLKQRDIADLLGIAQPDVSHLMNGNFNRFTLDKMFDFLKRLNKKITIRIADRKEDEPYQDIGLG